MIERVYKASALNIAIQDGPDAGQSVDHVHAHIIPRRQGDMDNKGGNDAIYSMMESEEGNVGKHLERKADQDDTPADGIQGDNRGALPGMDAEYRKPRSDEEMRKEAKWLASEMDKESDG